MQLQGIGIGGYRSFGPHQRIGPLSKVNLFIGGNNTGKSNILRFLRDHLTRASAAATQNAEFRFASEYDNPLSGGQFSFSLGYAPFEPDDLPADAVTRMQSAGYAVSELLQLVNQEALRHGTAQVWVDYRLMGTGTGNLRPTLPFDELQPPRDWRSLARELTSSTASADKDNIGLVYGVVLPRPVISQPYFVPAIREVKAGDVVPEDFSGAGLIDRLVQLRDPRFGREADAERFAAINGFVRDVLGVDGARLDIPHDRETILVYLDGKRLPLDSLGTGIHEVVILAAAATVLTDEIVCIEEPEIHLHPLLQRKLIGYLAKHTNNQYFIATHSAHLIDTPSASVFRVTLEEGTTRVALAVQANERFSICHDLGYRASDLLQTNAVIWVEGPSDRIYINHWLQAHRNGLVEGLHYSIMWYGGRLLSHLSTDQEVEEFIDLRRLNRNAVVVMDSDRDSEDDRLNDTKMRLVGEFDQEKGHGFSWVTQGREIENYVRPDLLNAVLNEINSDHGTTLAGTYERALRRPDGGTYDKIRVARAVVSRDPDLDVLDLRERITQLVTFIEFANHEEPSSGQRL